MQRDNHQIQYYISKKFIIPPVKYSCLNKSISLNKFNKNKNNGYCFRCTRKQCKKIYPLTKDSFFEEFKQKSIKELL